MASKARNAFDENMEDVARLLALHEGAGGNGPGRRYGLEVLNKSAVVLLTSYWESYCEDIAEEALELLVSKIKSPDELPESIRKLIVKELKEDKHDFAIWQLADDNWRVYLKSRLENYKSTRNRNFNTPKHAQVDELFETALGIKGISNSWLWDKTTAATAKKKLNNFVELRGAIAHRGKGEGSVTKKNVTDFKDLISTLAARTGGAVNRHIHKITGEKLF